MTQIPSPVPAKIEHLAALAKAAEFVLQSGNQAAFLAWMDPERSRHRMALDHMRAAQTWADSQIRHFLSSLS